MTTDALATTNASPLATTQMNPLAMLQSMIDRGADPDALGRMMDLAERWKASEAAENFANVLVEFQSRCPRIVKRTPVKTKSGDIAYYYAPIEDIMEQIQPLLSEMRISVRFSEDAIHDGKCTVTCYLQVGIHVAQNTVTIPVPPGNALINVAQSTSGCNTTAKRVALISALNLQMVGEDKDNAAPPEDVLSVDCAVAIQDAMAAMNATKQDWDKLLVWISKSAGFECKALDEVPASLYPKIMQALATKAKVRK